eukprot:6107490-Alexandrium_andersonii.AAC.1
MSPESRPSLLESQITKPQIASDSLRKCRLPNSARSTPRSLKFATHSCGASHASTHRRSPRTS